ncbi:DMSO/selenate family reductase complex A subunit [Ferrimonas senticii]|uniref:DMSO/selenate family reductase complex A subunit n=1 Tax=Ferrimonas senticii TaxID=394566 RepID=UPI00040AA243|nr:DMSO/selenate family reductase complex A subunit [Ferrimonas senticii]
MQRRDFLKLSATASAVTCITACGSKDEDKLAPVLPTQEQVNWSCCTCNCGHSCPLKVISVEGKIVRIETDDIGNDAYGNHQARACLKGRSNRKKVYSPDRLTSPMKRVGPRGLASSFVEISWEEAFDTIAANLKKVYEDENAGPSAVYPQYGTGRLYSCYGGGHWIHAGQWGGKLLNLLGGYLRHYGTYSSAQQAVAMAHTYGGGGSSSYTQMQHSDLIVAFGFNPAETRMSGTGGTYDWSEFIAGKETFVVDPRFSDSAVGKEVTWLPIRPGTDAALCEAIAYELINDGHVDKTFMDKYCVGYDADTLPSDAPANSDYYSHIMGNGDDGIPKTPEWAEAITGLPADEIRRLTKKLAGAERPFICQGLGPQRHAIGEQSVRAIVMLPLLLGKIGIEGTNSGVWPGTSGTSISFSPVGKNPYPGYISFFTWSDAVVRGTEFTKEKDGLRYVDKLNSNIRFIWNYAGNALINQHSDSFGTHDILASKESDELFILVHDVFMTPSAKYADILLPDITDFENTDVGANGGSLMETVVAMTPAIEPLFNAKGCFEVCLELAKRLGVENEFSEGRDYMGWVRHLYAQDQARSGGKLPQYDKLVEQGIVHIEKPTASYIAYKGYFEDPVANKLSTPSGKVEIYSATLQGYADTWTLPAGDSIPAIPKYQKTWESYEDEEARIEYPLQLIGHHTKSRCHSSFHNIPWLREAVEDSVWINPVDADAAGITDGVQVKVTSARASVIITAKVTPRIMPGVLSIAQGAWLKAENLADKIDIGGNVNSLTKYHPTPIGKCNPQHTNLVKVTLA